eukprot:TRINITY_DN6850_c0_g1_i1.p1 TRINITY_DN6850_c0_g1~~TRINITY_DN6850_c0_g1_i1.p1  ORF type:complete len:174 (-),score=29.99 TRINITY_DN6850_c0_g1_i1:41-562(-)
MSLQKFDKPFKTLSSHSQMVFGIHIKDKSIYSHSQDGTVKIWKLKNGDQKKNIELGYPVTSLSMNKNSFFTQAKTSVEVWNLKGKKCFSLDGHTAPVLTTARYKNYLVTGSIDRTIRIWDVKKGKQLILLRAHEGSVNSVEIKDRWVYSGSEDGTIRQWENVLYQDEEDHGWV